jgi:hypothetical protein
MKIKLILLFSLVILNTSLAQSKVKKHKPRDPIIENPTGVWEFYDYDGKLEQTYNFTSKTLVFQKSTITVDTAKHKVLIELDTIVTKLDKPAVIIGGESSFNNMFARNFRYTAEAKRNRIQGKAIISIIIDQEGNAISYKIKNRIGGGIDEEVIRVVKLAPYGWTPGILNGNKVISESILPITIRLQ